MSTLAELRDTLDGPSSEYVAKQMHRLPDFPVVDRERFILERVKDKVVLDVGASGRMHDNIVAGAKKCYGIDREDSKDVIGVDLDSLSDTFGLPWFGDVNLVVCGEVIEHLANPGNFLKHLRYAYKCPVIFTVPNAASAILQQTLRRGVECVNVDHKCWYSWRTMKTLLEKYDYSIKECYWYNGQPYFAEGLIFVC